ncbi:MAG: ADP-ribosyltransferase [Phycisphaerales bacterium]
MSKFEWKDGDGRFTPPAKRNKFVSNAGDVRINGDPDQPRADDGKWTDGAGGGASPADDKSSYGSTGAEVKGPNGQTGTVQPDGSWKQTPESKYRDGKYQMVSPATYNPPPAKGTPARRHWNDEEGMPSPGDTTLSGGNVEAKHYQLASQSVSSPISQEEANAISHYTTAKGYGPINDKLRSGKKLTGKAKAATAEMDAVFSRTSLARNVEGYRWVTPEAASSLGGLKEFKDDAFVSVTANDFDFAGANPKDARKVRVRVVMPKGSKALPIADHSSNMFGSRREAEVLIDRGSTFAVSKGGDGSITLTLKGK